MSSARRQATAPLYQRVGLGLAVDLSVSFPGHEVNMLRRRIGCLALLLCAVFAVASASAQEPAPAAPAAPAAPVGPAPHIKFDAVSIDLGDVIHGEDAVATFTYHNTGDAPLHILSAKPG